MFNEGKDRQSVETNSLLRANEPICDGRYIIFGVNNEERGILALRLSCTKNDVWRLQSADNCEGEKGYKSDGPPKFLEKGAAGTLAHDLGEKWEDPCCRLELSKVDNHYEIITEYGRCATLSVSDGTNTVMSD